MRRQSAFSHCNNYLRQSSYEEVSFNWGGFLSRLILAVENQRTQHGRWVCQQNKTKKTEQDGHLNIFFQDLKTVPLKKLPPTSKSTTVGNKPFLYSSIPPLFLLDLM